MVDSVSCPSYQTKTLDPACYMYRHAHVKDLMAAGSIIWDYNVDNPSVSRDYSQAICVCHSLPFIWSGVGGGGV